MELVAPRRDEAPPPLEKDGPDARQRTGHPSAWRGSWRIRDDMDMKDPGLVSVGADAGTQLGLNGLGSQQSETHH